MLRLVMGVSLLAMTMPVMAENNPGAADYREPTKAELEMQQSYIQDGLKKTEDYLKSDDFKDKLATERAKVNSAPTIFAPNKLEVPTEFNNQKWVDRFNELADKASGTLKAPPKAPGGPLVFASLSLPRETLQILAEQANKVGGTVVFRGVKNDSFKEMRKALSGLGAGFAIDPTLFQRFHIQEVPAFVLPVDPIMPCEENGCPPARHVKVSGNVTLEAALDYMQIQSQEAGGKEMASDLLKKLREK